MFRGVIGLAYPKAFKQTGLNPDSQTIPQVTESAKGHTVLKANGHQKNIIHFDLDPRNSKLSPKPPLAGTDMTWQVLVGDYDERDHAHAPIFKVPRIHSLLSLPC